MCSTAALSGFVALQILCSSTNKWFADPQTTCIVGVPLPQTLCLRWVQSKDQSIFGCGLQKGQRKWAWFSEPPNKELDLLCCDNVLHNPPQRGGCRLISS